jgi:hypothetical protein
MFGVKFFWGFLLVLLPPVQIVCLFSFYTHDQIGAEEYCTPKQMVVEATDNGWDLATNNQKQILRLKALLRKVGILISGEAS